MAAQKNVEIVQDTIITRVPTEFVKLLERKKQEKQLEYEKKGINKKVTRTMIAVEFMNWYLEIERIKEE